MRSKIVCAAVVTLLAASCSKTPDQETPKTEPIASSVASGTAPAAATTTVTEAAGQLPEFTVTVDDASKRPDSLGAGKSIKGEVHITNGGSIKNFGVQLGNFGNKSDGMFKITVCNATKTCASGERDLKESKDNDMFSVSFAMPLAVATGEVVSYTLERLTGNEDLVVWTFQSPDAKTTINLVGTPEDRTPRITLRY